MQPVDCPRTASWEEAAGSGGMSRDEAEGRGAPVVVGQRRLIWRLGPVLALMLLLLGPSVSAQKAGTASQFLSDQQIEASLDPEHVDGSTDDDLMDSYGQVEGGKDQPMEFIPKFGWERAGGKGGAREEAERRGRKKRPADNEYDEVLAARLVAEEDVDRLSTAEGGDRLLYAFGPEGQGNAAYLAPSRAAMPPIWTSTASSTATFPSSSSSSPFATRSTKFPLQSSTRLPKLSASSQQMVKPSERTMALSELDLKSDGELAKMMRRTTLRTRQYPVERTTPSPPTVWHIQSLPPPPSLQPFPLLPLATPQAPPLLTIPGLLPFPQPSFSPAVPSTGQNSHQNRRGLKPEQFEQLGCAFDFMSQSCRDFLRLGWCQNCVDFGNPFLHDCRCTAVTGLYVQTATFLGSSAASARANAAVTANQTAPGSVYPVFPALPLLPTLEQLAAPLQEATGRSGPPSTSSSPFLSQTATPASQVIQALADAFHLPQTPMPFLGVPSASSQGAQPQQATSFALAPLLAPPARAFGAVQFMPPSSAAPIVPQYVGQGGKRK